MRRRREFIKDLWYRNKQEKQVGQLEILRQSLAIEREFGPYPRLSLIDWRRRRFAELVCLGNLRLKASLWRFGVASPPNGDRKIGDSCSSGGESGVVWVVI
jgi:hypothetical protein